MTWDIIVHKYTLQHTTSKRLHPLRALPSPTPHTTPFKGFVKKLEQHLHWVSVDSPQTLDDLLAVVQLAMPPDFHLGLEHTHKWTALNTLLGEVTYLVQDDLAVNHHITLHTIHLRGIQHGRFNSWHASYTAVPSAVCTFVYLQSSMHDQKQWLPHLPGVLIFLPPTLQCM